MSTTPRRLSVVESCPVCGFVWEAVPETDVLRRIDAGVHDIRATLSLPGLTWREHDQRWTSLEYAGHVRDVLLNLRDRMIVGLVLDNPQPPSMFSEVRVQHFYADDPAGELDCDLQVAASLFNRSYAGFEPFELRRRLVYPWPREASRTLLWVAAQAVHEVEHHSADIAENLRRYRRYHR